MESIPLQFPRWAKIATVVIVVLLFILLLRAMGSLMLPFLWAIVTAYLLSPIVRTLSARTRLPRFVWVLFLYVLFGFLIFTMVNTLVPVLSNQLSDLRTAAPHITQNLIDWIDRRGTIQIGVLTYNLRPAEADIAKWISGIASGIPASVPRIVFNVLEGLILWLIFLVVTFYLLLQGERIIDNLYRLVPAPHRAEIRALGHSIDHVLGAYIRSQIILIIVMSLVTWTALTVLGVQYALILGIVTGFLEVIPFVGPYMAAGTAIVVALVQSVPAHGWPSWFLAAAVAIVYLVLRQTEDHLVMPKLVGHIVRLHPIIVIFAVLAGGHLGGPLGLFVAVPVAASSRIVLAYLYSKLVDAPLVDTMLAVESGTSPPAHAEALPATAPVRSRGELHDEAVTR